MPKKTQKFTKKKIKKDLPPKKEEVLEALAEKEKEVTQAILEPEEQPEKPTSSESREEKKEEEEIKWKVHHIGEKAGAYTDELVKDLLDYLAKLSLLNEEQKERVQQIYKQEGRNIADIIIEQKILKEHEIGRVFAEFFHCRYIDLKSTQLDSGAIKILPKEVAETAMAITFRENEEAIAVAMVDPFDIHFLHLLEKKTGKKTEVFYTTPEQIQAALKSYQRGLGEGIEELISKASQDIERLETLDNISKIFDTLILMAYNRGASDIHVEPFENEIRLRFRIDGVLETITNLPTHFLDTIVNHVKVLSQLRTDEHQSSQDGRFNITYDQTRIHFRVSILPTHYGEKIVLRLLPVEAQELTLTTLGYQELDQTLIEKAIHKSNGIILVTGPTGSGKTTTLYSLIKLLNEEGVNISTIEDPIEYGIHGINQTQVNAKTNITFAAGLRTLLRQDPDILMIGEIRDQETAQIAMHAALTGHLVFSTLHTNSATLAPLRMVQMGVDPYLITSTLNVIIAQRLLRRICPHCMVSYKVSEEELKTYEGQFLSTEEDRALLRKYFEKMPRLFKGKGCKKCGETGYRGRTVVAEVLKMKKNIRELVLKEASESEIRETAQQNGMTSMLEDGFQKVLSGVTTLEELFRILNQ